MYEKIITVTMTHDTVITVTVMHDTIITVTVMHDTVITVTGYYSAVNTSMYDDFDIFQYIFNIFHNPSKYIADTKYFIKRIFYFMCIIHVFLFIFLTESFGRLSRNFPLDTLIDCCNSQPKKSLNVNGSQSHATET